MTSWTKEEIDILIENYPNLGKQWCMTRLNRSECSVRKKTETLKLKQNIKSDFFKCWQSKAANSKVGKKRPDQALVMKNNFATGKMIKTLEQKKAIGEKTKNWIIKNGHPKGSLGIKHTKETKEKISISSKKMWENMSEENKDAYSQRASINARNASVIGNRSKASWKSGWREIGLNKKYYRSRWEANYARYLEWLRIKGEILDWKHEDTTFWFEGIKRGVMSYLPDFHVFNNNGSDEYHEVKGWMDDKSITKLKRMTKYHPNVKMVLIDSKSYKLLDKQIKHFIEGWEI